MSQPARRGDEGRDPQPRDGKCGEKAGQDAEREDEDEWRARRKVPAHQGDRGDGPEEAREEPDGKVDVPDDDDEGHADGEHRDVAGLVEEVRDVARGDEQPLRQ